MTRAFESVTATEIPGAGRLRALVVDDRRPVVGSLAEFLHREQFVVHVSSTGDDTLRSALDYDPDLVVLDLAIPGFDAVAVCRELRSVSDAHLVVLSARQGILDALGEPVVADEFIVDPISPRELVTHLRAMIRRPNQITAARTGTPRRDPRQPASKSVGKLRIDVAHRCAVIDDTPLPLTRIEFEILAALASRPGSVFTRKQLLAAVWGSQLPSARRVLVSTSGICVASSATIPLRPATSSPCEAVDTDSRRYEGRPTRRTRRADPLAGGERPLACPRHLLCCTVLFESVSCSVRGAVKR